MSSDVSAAPHGNAVCGWKSSVMGEDSTAAAELKLDGLLFLLVTMMSFPFITPTHFSEEGLMIFM